MDRNDCLIFVTSFLMLVWFCQFWKLWQSKGRKIEPAKKVRQLRARTPDDCPYCRQKHASRCEPVVRQRDLPRVVATTNIRSVLECLSLHETVPIGEISAIDRLRGRGRARKRWPVMKRGC